jgi:hypothetical protein
MSAANIASDVCPFALPERIVWGLQLPVPRKAAVSALILVGPTVSLVFAAPLCVSTCPQRRTLHYSLLLSFYWTILFWERD